jgi:hypothetical protein
MVNRANRGILSSTLFGDDVIVFIDVEQAPSAAVLEAVTCTSE